MEFYQCGSMFTHVFDGKLKEMVCDVTYFPDNYNPMGTGTLFGDIFSG